MRDTKYFAVGIITVICSGYIGQQCSAEMQTRGGNVHHFMLQRHPGAFKTDKPCDEQKACKPFHLGQQATYYYILEEIKGTRKFP